MKTKIFGLIALLLAGTAALAASFTSDEINLMNSHWGSVPRQIQLGTHLSTIETNASGAATLATGKIFVGNASNIPTAVTPTGDVTWSNAGVTAIGAGKVTEAMQVPLGSDGLGSLRIAKATYDFAVNGGTIGAIALAATLPAKSTIIRSWFYVVTQLAGTSGATIALSCETAGNIFAAADETGVSAGAYVEGLSTGASSAFKSITSACAITATIAVHNLTAGKIDIYTSYVVHD